LAASEQAVGVQADVAAGVLHRESDLPPESLVEPVEQRVEVSDSHGVSIARGGGRLAADDAIPTGASS
jgi:hypothetical protein